MGTKLRRKSFTRKEKIEMSKGRTPKRLKDFLNRMTIKTDDKEVKANAT